MKASQITVDIPATVFGQSTEQLAKHVRLLPVLDELLAGRLTRTTAARARRERH